MREIVMDTETTGLSPEEGHRIVEIGCVELWNHVATGRTFHRYIDPERPMPPEAFAVHGLGDDFLAGKPKFAEVADDFRDFVADAPLVIHNAAFDMAFLNAELRWAGRPALPPEQAVDTLAIARRRHPGGQNSLDALCRRYGVDNSGREKHGALLDSEILAEVYLELIGGRQPGFALALATSEGEAVGTRAPAAARPEPLPPRLTEAERARHAAFVAELEGGGLWEG